MKRVTVTITTDSPVNVKITPNKDALDELLEAIEGADDGAETEEGADNVVEGR